jgi:endonuclease G, mitochondrial
VIQVPITPVMKYLRHLTAAFLISLVATLAAASDSNCPANFAGENAPVIIEQSLLPKSHELCMHSFGVLYSGLTRTPLWSAEHLTRGRIQQAHEQVRRNAYHPEVSLPAIERAELKDYSRSGFDRGHMIPSADMPDEQSQYDSFTLANMVPQDPRNNRGIWEGIELAVRHLTDQRGELYVITGPLFVGSSIQQLNGRVLVPTHIYKVVYDLQRNEAAAYLVKNVDTRDVQQLSVEEIGKMAGFDFLPTIKSSRLALPNPTPQRYDKHFRRNRS